MRVNYCTNPSGELNTTGHTAVPGTTGVVSAGVVSTTSATAAGTKVARTTWTTASTAAGGGEYYELTLAGSGLAVGDVISAGIFHILAHITNRLQFSLGFYNGAALIGSATAGAAKVVTADTIYGTTAAADSSFEIDNITIPATTTKIRLSVLSVAGTSYANWSIGSYLDVDMLQIVKGATLGAYLDGDQPGAFWAGAVQASSSELPTLVPVLTATIDASPCPRVLVVLPELPTVAKTVTFSRVAEGRTFPVRGGVSLFAGGSAAVLDFEVPFGVATTYRAEMFDASGVSLGFTQATAVTISPSAALTGLHRAWVHQPLKPSLAIQCTLLMGTADSISRPNPGDVFYPEGATVGTRVGSRRHGVAAVPLKIIVDSLSDGDEFQAMFGDYTSDFPAVICIRTAAPLRLPRTFFANVDPAEVAYERASKLTYTMDADEVRPPAPGLVIPTLRRADIDIAFSTRAARAAAYATRLARDTDYTKAGLAG